MLHEKKQFHVPYLGTFLLNKGKQFPLIRGLLKASHMLIYAVNTQELSSNIFDPKPVLWSLEHFGKC